MSVEAPPRYENYDESLAGYGWVVFAGVLLLILATVNIIEGVGAIGNSHFFAANAHYVFGDLKTWGWVALLIGVIQGLAGIGVFLKNQLARWVGVGILLINAIAQLLMIQASSYWALSVFAVDVLAVYGLIAHGRRIGED
jgi:hypothetical protein